MRVSAPLLSLLGHELRAPAGVLGGYLAMLEKDADRLSVRQQQALAGARRAQQTIVDGLDDLRRLTIAWRAEDEPLTWIGLANLVQEVVQIAAARRVPLTVDAATSVAVPRRGRDASLAESLVTLAEAVGRETGGAVTATAAVSADGRALVWQVRPAEAPEGAARHVAFDLWRPGLGVRLVTAAVTIETSGGTLEDVRADGSRAGIDVRFPLGPDDAAADTTA
ncbi:MAG: hypothetical protein R2708_05350 [Vicinamibacterales bacterium]